MDNVINQPVDKVTPPPTSSAGDWASKFVQDLHTPAPNDAQCGIGTLAGVMVYPGDKGYPVITSGPCLNDGTVKTLPGLELSNDPNAEKNLPNIGHKQWTVAVDLMASFAPTADNPKGGGVDRELAELKKMAEETRDHSVAFVVHAQRPLDEEGKPCGEKTDLKSDAACVDKALNTGLSTTERFVIHDGKIDRLPDVDYIMPAADMQALVSEAGKIAPSDKLGLIFDSHGAGNMGLAGNNGEVSLEEMTGAVRLGLNDTGHKRLDLLDFNACDMAEAKVLESSRLIADDLVASSAAELVRKDSTGQNMDSAFHALLNNPGMSGRDLGIEIVDQANRGLNGSGYDSATPTLANFDLTKYNDFDTSLSKFGTALSALTENSDNLKLLQSDINQSRIPDSGKPLVAQHERDIHDFAQNILRDSKEHKFSGDNSALEESATSLLKAMESMVTNKYGIHEKGYDTMGGLSVVLPGDELLKTDLRGTRLDSLHQLGDFMSNVVTVLPGIEHKPALSKFLDRNLNEIPFEAQIKYPNEMHQLIQAERQVKNAHGADYHKALVNMQKVIERVDAGPMGKMIANKPAEVERQIFELKPTEDLNKNWDGFIKKLEQANKQ